MHLWFEYMSHEAGIQFLNVGRMVPAGLSVEGPDVESPVH